MKIEGIELTEQHIGKTIFYTQPGRKLEVTQGIINGWDDRFVFVSFPISSYPHKCEPTKLKWRKY